MAEDEERVYVGIDDRLELGDEHGIRMALCEEDGARVEP